jgi:hypothetical protein
VFLGMCNVCFLFACTFVICVYVCYLRVHLLFACVFVICVYVYEFVGLH